VDLDEAPPAVLRQSDDPVMRPISPSDNRGADASIGQQLQDVPDGRQVIIKIVVGGD
jgi:hypothetical protein